MANQFNFFRGMIGPRVVATGGALLNEPYIPLQITDPPYGISRRHWNMLPQDLRGGEREGIELYIEGWEAARNANYNNPYPDQLRGEVWNRGWHRAWNRRGGRTREYTERDMEYYHTEEFLFFDVSEERYGLVDGLPYKVMLFRSIEEGNTVEGQTIYPTDYMYNFPDVI
jgi:hypothetical protein